eukprot:COSAG06_NODE_858_length_11909_cov_6.018036_4_plen_92_part_00
MSHKQTQFEGQMEAFLRAMDIYVKTAGKTATNPDSNPEADAMIMWDGAGTVDSGCRRAGGRSCDTEARPIRKRRSLFWVISLVCPEPVLAK